MKNGKVACMSLEMQILTVVKFHILDFIL